MNQSISSRIGILDPLRFAAALAVVVYHYSIYFDYDPSVWLLRAASFGYLGVPFFFILSGFVITASAKGRGAFEFALSRAARLYPAFWVCLILTALVIVFVGGEDISLKQVALNATIMNDYFRVPDLDGVYWTLQAEIKFYACVFLLLLSGLFKYTRTWLSIWLLTAIAFHYFSQPFFMGWFINPSYSFYFIGGVCAYLLYENKKNYYVLLLMLIALIFSIIKSGEQINSFFPSAENIDKRIAAAIVITFFAFFYLLSRGWFVVKSSKLLMLMGAVSYPLYLIHNAAGKEIIDYCSSEINKTLAAILVAVLAIGVSIIIHLYFEKPLSARFNAVGKGVLRKLQPTAYREKIKQA